MVKKSFVGLLAKQPSSLSYHFQLPRLNERNSGRRKLVNLRIRNHKLLIELCRYNQPFQSIKWKTKLAFSFCCPTYSLIRNNFYNEVKTLIPNITQLPVNVLNNELQQYTIHEIIISACFDFRDELLTMKLFVLLNFSSYF